MTTQCYRVYYKYEHDDVEYAMLIDATSADEASTMLERELFISGRREHAGSENITILRVEVLR